ncbi:MaoC/PaaZ C-terminal domain-containing protein [Microbacterium sp.]|uniref:MaoC/PaaZ C-terminal domain-containing protein n=1 Tax=Microbacterium sp. TaxID=51671 RepID=UPI002FE31CE2
MAYAVGDTIAERTVHLDRESLVRYAGASGDFNPIHYRDDVAASVGLPGVLAHGMLTMGIASSVVVAALEPGTRILDYGVRFTKPVVVDATDGADVHVLATVGAVDDESARIDLKVTFDETTVLVKAQLRVAV